jgi:hypothetical protein
VEVDDELVLLIRESTVLDVRAEVVGPPEAAALAALEPGGLGEEAPAAVAVLLDVVYAELVLLQCPQACSRRPPPGRGTVTSPLLLL